MQSCGLTTGGKFWSQAPPGSRRAPKEAMSLDPLGRRPRIPGVSIGRGPVKRTGVRSIYTKINLASFVFSQEIGTPTSGDRL